MSLQGFILQVAKLVETYKAIEPKGWQNHPGNMAAMAVSNMCLPSIVQVIKSTGFFRGLYTPQELDAKSIQVHTTHIDTLCMYMCVIVYMFGVRGYRLYTVLQTIYFLCRTRIQRLLSCRRHWTHFVSCIHCIHMGMLYSGKNIRILSLPLPSIYNWGSSPCKAIQNCVRSGGREDK